MNTREDLVVAIRRAINDPGRFVKRDKVPSGWGDEEYESVGNWGARAVLTSVVEPLQADAERLRIALADALNAVAPCPAAAAEEKAGCGHNPVEQRPGGEGA